MSERSSTETRQANPSSRKARLGWLIKRMILMTLLAVTVGVGVIIYLASSQPAYWKEHQQFLAKTSPRQIEALAGQVDDKFEALANLGLEQTPSGEDDDPGQPKIKPEDVHINTEQTIALNNEQLAAIVQTRMDTWMKERGYKRPDELHDPMIAVKDGELVMAFRFQSGHFRAIISGKFILNILDNGMAELSLNRFFVGQLPVPADALGEHLRQQTNDDKRAQQAGEWLGKLQYLKIKPVLELEHRRRARVMDYKLHDDSLELTVRVQDHKTYKAMNVALAGVPTD